MTDIDVLKRKLSNVEKYFQRLKSLRKKPKREIQSDMIVYGAVERYLYLLCQATIDFAEAIISYTDLRKPGSYKEVFDILSEGEGLISTSLALKMKKMAGFRNILAHDYVKIDFDGLYEVLIEGVNDISKFLIEVRKKIKID